MSQKESKEEQLLRIQELEACFVAAARAVVNLQQALSQYQKAAADIERLEGYYTSKQWLEDFCSDEAGELPQELPRGILAEDGIYDLLTENDEVKEKIREIFGPKEVK